MQMTIMLLGVFLLSLSCHKAEAATDFTSLRAGLVRQIEESVRETRHYIDKERLDPRVMETMGSVPRHEFVPNSQRRYAYENRPLGIGHGQTISQPYIVALMTDLLEVGAEDLVLEVGTGSGYQAAVLARLVKKVYSIEIIEPLGRMAEKRFRRLGINNIVTRIGDGYYGWEEHGPFDAIVVTAAAGHVPPPLVKQLKVGGRMVIPVGGGFQTQQLLLVTKEHQDRITTHQILPVVFVPLTGGH
ncbi:MAG: protein-L-isoaspartate(D-aspartate) O-methyltransferase [Desulforhopalus sp.]